MTIKSFQLSGWTKSYDGGARTVTLSGGSLSPSQNLNLAMVFDIGDIAGQSGTWTVVASENADGSGSFSCSGDHSAAVQGGATDTTAPVISGIAVSSITTSSAVVAWSTDEDSDSLVKYDVNADAGFYPFSHSSSTQTVSHSLTVTNSLAASTTYYYVVCSTDGSGNQSCSAENNFTTSAAAAATVTPTPTTATAATATPTGVSSTSSVTTTPTPIPIERIPPKVTVDTKLDESYEVAPLISGTATDNKGVVKIEYSIDGGVNWLIVDESEGLVTTNATYELVPFILEDGNYDLLVRATDAAGNVGLSEKLVLIIDRLPPRVGGNLLALGPHPLLPNEDGVIITTSGLEMRITLSTVGGPTAVDLMVDEQLFSLGRSPDTGLWAGAINLKNPGVYQLSTRAIDGAGNKTERNINKIVVLRSGFLYDEESKDQIMDGEMSLYYQDPLSLLWTLWDGRSFGQENPQNLDETGGYQYFLPPGTYYLTIKSKKHATLTSKIFKLDHSTPFNADFYLKPAKQLNLGPFTFSLPDFTGARSEVVITTPEIPDSAKINDLIGTETPYFSLPATKDTATSTSLRGSASVITFVNTWSPQSVEQVSIVDDLLDERRLSGMLVSTQENLSKLLIFTKRGNYKAPIAVDVDGELVEEYQVGSMPTHFFLNRRGVIERIVTAVLNEEEIFEILDSI